MHIKILTLNMKTDLSFFIKLDVEAVHLMVFQPIFSCGNLGPQVHCYYSFGNNEKLRVSLKTPLQKENPTERH